MASKPSFLGSTSVAANSTVWLVCTMVFLKTEEQPTLWAMFLCIVLSSWMVFYTYSLELKLEK